MKIGFNHDKYTVRLPKDMGGDLLEIEVSTHLEVALRVTPWPCIRMWQAPAVLRGILLNSCSFLGFERVLKHVNFF